MSDYIPYGSRCKCSCGNMENYLSTDKGHGVLYVQNPLMNANDHEVGINITHFGECKMLKSAILKMPEKCKPILPTPWINVNKDYIIDGAPALTSDSLLACYEGGVISICEVCEVSQVDENTEE